MPLFSTEKSKFKSEHSLEERISESSKIRSKYSDRIPVIVEAKNSKVPQIDKVKFLVPNDLTVGGLIWVIRKRAPEIGQNTNLFLYTNGILPPTSHLMSSLYEEQKDEDGFLYCVYSTETFFGQ